MARMHSGKHGRAASHKPSSKIAPSWLKASREEVVELVEKYAREGLREARIGLLLRDQHGIPNVKLATKKTISQILEEQNLKPQYPSDLLDLVQRAARMRKHLETQKHDQANEIKLKHVESKIKRLERYYRDSGRIPANWKYSPETAALLVK